MHWGQDERNSADHLLLMISFTTPMTYDLKTACFSADKRWGLEYSVWDGVIKGYLSWWPKIPGQESLPMSNPCHCHIHILLMGEEVMSSGLNHKEPPVRRPMGTVYHAGKGHALCRYHNSTLLPPSDSFQSTESCTRLWSMKLMSAPSLWDL